MIKVLATRKGNDVEEILAVMGGKRNYGNAEIKNRSLLRIEIEDCEDVMDILNLLELDSKLDLTKANPVYVTWENHPDYKDYTFADAARTTTVLVCTYHEFKKLLGV